MKRTGKERAKTMVVYQSQETNAVALFNYILDFSAKVMLAFNGSPDLGCL